MNLPPSPLIKALDSPLFQVGDTVLEMHQVRKRLGKGSITRSYQVYRDDWQQDLILKVPRTALLRDGDGLAHWIKQANAWIGLGQHPQLVTAYYLQIQQQVPYLVTDCVAGYRLSERIKSGQLYVYEDSLKDLLDIAIQAATGLAYGHEQGLLHTHFKPSKVLLMRDNSVKITDFGLTPRLPSRQKMDSLLAKQGSTWAYASPEQLEGLELSVQSDIWSWAVTVLELFMGELTWAVGIAAPEVLTEYQQTAGEDESKPVMPQALFDLLDHCLQITPAQRPRDMASIVSRLTPIYMAATQQPYPRFAAQSNRPAAAEFMSSLVLERVTAVYEVAQAASSLPLPETAQRYLQQARQALAQQDYAQTLIEIAAARSEPNCSQANEIMALWTMLYQVLPRLKLRDGWPIYSGVAPCPIVNMVTTLKECYGIVQNAQGTVQLWHPALGLFDLARPLAVEVGTALTLSACGRYAAMGYADHSIRLWDTTTRQCVQVFSGHPGGVTALALSADFHYLLSGGADGCVRLWDCASGHCLQQYRHHEQPLLAVALSADACYALSIAHNKVACQWPLRKPKQLQTLICSRIPEVIALSADGHHLAVSADNQVWLWSISSGQCVATLKVETVVTALALDIDGQRVILGDEQGQISIWGFTRKQCEYRLQGHQAAIQALALALDGRYLLSTDAKGVVKQWMLDWKMEASSEFQWDATLLRWVADFLAQRQPYRGQLQAEHPPTVNEVHQALTRQGKPHWVETDLQQLLYQLACAGYGRLSRHDLEHRLQVRLKFYPDPLQLALGLKHWVRHYWQQQQLRWSQRHLRALQQQDHTRRLQRQQMLAQSRQRTTQARLKRNLATHSPPFAPVWLDILRFTLLALVFHDLGHYGILAFTSVVSVQSQPHNSVYLPVNPLEAIDAVALKQAETQLALNFVEQRRELVTMIYANMPTALIQAEAAQIQATLDQVKAIIPIQLKLMGDQKRPQLRFIASIPGNDGKSYAVPINMQRGSKLDIHYEPTFADRLAKQRNDYQAGKGAQWLWVQPYLLAVDGRLWHSPKPPVALDRF